MKIPRISTLLIIGQFLLILICLGLFGYALANNWCLKMEAEKYARDAGFAEATHNYLRGDYCLYELKLFKFGVDSGAIPTDGTTESTDKMNGAFHVRNFMADQNGFEFGHQEIQQTFVDAYNEHMHHYFDHPEWFDKNGQRIPARELKQKTNN
jgi:hypothetical protein